MLCLLKGFTNETVCWDNVDNFFFKLCFSTVKLLYEYIQRPVKMLVLFLNAIEKTITIAKFLLSF